MSLFFHLPQEASTSASGPPLPALDSVVLVPLTRRSYTLAQTSPSQLIDLLASQPEAVIRTGDVLSLGSEWGRGGGEPARNGQARDDKDDSGEVRAWRVVMTEPVLMGLFVRPTSEDNEEEAEEDLSTDRPRGTEIMVAPYQADKAEASDEDHLARSTSSLSQRSDSSSASSQRTVKPILSPPPTPPPDDDDLLDGDEEDAEDDFEITSSFLQSALLPSSASSVPRASSISTNLADSVSSLASNSSAQALQAGSGRPYDVGALASRLGDGVAAAEEDEFTMWVRTRVLGEVGCFDGDWVRSSLILPLLWAFTDDVATSGRCRWPSKAAVQTTRRPIHLATGGSSEFERSNKSKAPRIPAACLLSFSAISALCARLSIRQLHLHSSSSVRHPSLHRNPHPSPSPSLLPSSGSHLPLARVSSCRRRSSVA